MGLLFYEPFDTQLLNTAPRLLLCRLALQHLGCQFLCCGLIVGVPLLEVFFYLWAPDDELASERQTLLHLFGQAQDPCRLIDRRLILSPFTIDLAKCLFPLLPKVDGRIRQVPFEDFQQIIFDIGRGEPIQP